MLIGSLCDSGSTHRIRIRIRIRIFFISINNDIANLYIKENYTNVNIAIMVISIRVMIIKYNIQN